MTHFKLAPTSKEYLDTPFVMMEELFLNFLKSPDYDIIRKRYRDRLLSKNDERHYLNQVENLDDSLEELGYTAEELDKIKSELREDYYVNANRVHG
jgi:hypothetical protein